jgi:hypothetical protein
VAGVPNFNQLTYFKLRALSFNNNPQFSSLPAFVPNLTVPGWSVAQQTQSPYVSAMPIQSQNLYDHSSFDPNNLAYPFPVENSHPEAYTHQYWDMDTGDFGNGMTQMQYEESLRNMETDGMEGIQTMISHTLAAFTPQHPPSKPSY